MTHDAGGKETQTMQVEFAAAPAVAADVASSAEEALDEALRFSARRMNLDGPDAVLDLLGRGDAAACRYCYYGLAKQVAEYLATVVEDVKAVYVGDFDATPEDTCFCEAAPSLIHLIVWANRKSAALDSLAFALDRALVQVYASRLSKPGLRNILDIQVVDDKDVNHRIGYGALLSSLHQRPIRVWPMAGLPYRGEEGET